MTSKKAIGAEKRPRPYFDTKVSPEETKMDIDRMLKAYGIRDIQWTSFHGGTELKFMIQIESNGVQREITFAFKPPIILVPRRNWNMKLGRYEKVNLPHEAMSYRLLWPYLKAKLEAISWGLETAEKEFLAHVLVALPNGQETTIGDQLQQVMESTRKALEQKPAEPVNITETTALEH